MTRKIQTVAVVLLAVAMIGADTGGGGCTGTGASSTMSQKTMIPSGPLPYCYEDPPLGCWAICNDVGEAGFTPACSNIEAGMLTDAFEAKIQTIINAANAQGVPLCTADNIGATTTPCAVGITPVELANQDHTVCMSAPPGCPW
jgi:hypothetical protein